MSQPRLLGGRYELDGVVGRGGMAEVFRARDLRLDRLVAVKTLRSDLARDHTFQERFRREAQSAASLNHPSIIAVYDTGEDMVDGISIPFIIMEYVDGRTLKELLDDDRRLLPERTLEITDGILRALEYSHRNGIVHRDIKPANVMLTRQAEVKVMDFGIARSMNDAQATMTQTSQVIGTAQYLSPEQARGERVDARSDIYSTGCVLYELLTGRPPFTGDSPVSIAYQHVREDPVPPSQLDPEVPEWIEAIVLRAMAKDRDERYQSAGEMRADIQRGLQGMPTEASTMAITPAGATTTLPPVQDNRYDDRRRYDDYDDPYDDDRRGDGRKRALWLLLALAVLGALVFAGWMFLRGGTETTPIPDVSGLSAAEAEASLQDAGFVNLTTEERGSDEVDEGEVIETDPPAGRSVSETTTITIIVSNGPESVEVPDVAGMTQTEATQELQNLGLALGDVTYERSDSQEANRVIRTDPEAGASVDPSSQVALVISEGPNTVEVPDVANMTEGEARAALEGQNLTVRFEQEENGDVEPGRAIRQNPAAGQQVPPGSEVVVTLAQQPEESSSPPPPGNGNGDGNSQEPPPGWPTDLPWDQTSWREDWDGD
ncbi:Stk1 family PASTA domain-containing Ser/Thr kinase [Marinitenerispora sediminis]|uniref:non-specific serine/threonine protein kinase n=1 Tax=Marinitenerispora sediminis TaxID=1931232 RepID=A0A368T347_9ACTN|nr:Stk1 family PASTA domain-containing Ser/Thr kinase [Marinitenerispora sediminis]RCV50947.1 Stk1 family PASTA domain-containing Ser/Thr kinase [Marinitenerispora sediminis]RCV56350.1 Stk1 family PASTA domain-containing Ser/Thr kinase [Marinitenerispora sediminis]RCV60410.1 Stk1 family PASTA domain-containing Ser/Thr kinase [Marinitenerispora sediminis]